MKYTHVLPLAIIALLVACTDTTGISAESRKGPHPDTNANAVVVVHEFGDLQCPACRAAHSKVVAPLLEKYGNTIRYEFKHFPLRAIHPHALVAAEAAECAADQDTSHFWEFVDIAFERQPEMNRETIFAWAEELGLDMDHFGRCMKSHIKKDVVMMDHAEGQEVDVKGTPTFFVNGQKVESTIEAISAAIEEALAQVQQKL
ncbi:disulfide bond formation protein DsbA [Candidatus Peregrinibacteria bacterium CG10_big_fil_rev_8_21_14_0_10_49_16]|nr:MAG: disulfide bond formation protein DsbA [Candidatus Peregrinibacteria bacterium CG22_combo_CG10-13_8_21_14_all_49_11]PIR51980.1 MAG: disulfide bond formation protein DsbA [Candidatus Peregrinibacteria bacterium CG10_big_fil_rev_8_21_14_0_10_49_16]